MRATVLRTVVLTATLDTAETLLYRPADLAIVKALSSVQSNLYYTVMVTNQGLGAAENVRVTDTLPAGTTFDSALPQPDNISGSDEVGEFGLFLNYDRALVPVCIGV